MQECLLSKTLYLDHPALYVLSHASADKMETLTGQLGQTGSQPATRGYNTTEPARVAGEGALIPTTHESFFKTRSVVPGLVALQQLHMQQCAMLNGKQPWLQHHDMLY